MSGAVWRDLDQAGLDAELNLRARWPDHPQVFARWADDSARVRREHPARLDLPYGAGPRMRLDLFPAAGGEAAPLMIFIHGGYWQGLSRSHFSYLAPAFTAAGIAFAALGYDLAPQVSLGTIVGEIDQALAFVAREAPGWGCDPARLHLSGHSAGGHLAAMALIRQGLAAADGGPPPSLRSACAVSGVYDLAPIRRSYHQPVLRLTEREVAALSPLRVAPAEAAPLLLAVGSEETAEFLRQQAALEAQWRALDLPVEAMLLEGRGHFTAIDAMGEPGHPLFLQLRDLVLAS